MGPISLFEQDPRHVELLLEHLEFVETKVKGVSTPGEKSGTCYDETDFEKSKVTLYGSCVMRFANLSANLSHSQFCPNRLARGMHWSRLKRVARYLRTHGRWIHTVVGNQRVCSTLSQMRIGRVPKPIKNCILCSVSHPMPTCYTVGTSSIFS